LNVSTTYTTHTDQQKPTPGNCGVANQERTPTVSRPEERAPNSVSTLAHPEMRNKREEGRKNKRRESTLSLTQWLKQFYKMASKGLGFSML